MTAGWIAVGLILTVPLGIMALALTLIAAVAIAISFGGELR